jgi:hypothetical protein
LFVCLRHKNLFLAIRTTTLKQKKKLRSKILLFGI